MMTAQFPPWLRRRVFLNKGHEDTMQVLRDHKLNTVCQSARCPNIWECFSQRTATFMILGAVCTRNCSFCGVSKGKPQSVDSQEPARIAGATERLGLRHVVVTSVTRDDLADGGADQFVRVIIELRKLIPPVSVEVLTPDFKGDVDAIVGVAKAGVDVYNHNVETVPRLYQKIRPQADYQRSLDLLKLVKDEVQNCWTKSGLMLGLGEIEEEVIGVFEDLRDARCDIITIGQYLKPTPESHPVERFVPPEEFDIYKEKAHRLGFRHVFSGPFVRSSYHACMPNAQSKDRISKSEILNNIK